MKYPRISIVTPSYNQDQFLEETILSVLGQNYPNLEYIILDGGSTDKSTEIIKKYEKYLTYWESQKDQGQAHAINKGFSMATGDILSWLNSDDFYLPGALLYISSKLDISSSQLVFGDCVVVREDKGNRAYAMVVKDRDKKTDLINGSIAQSSAFWTKETWKKVGLLNADMHFAFDLEWFNRAKMKGIQFIYVPKHLSVFRSHKICKTNIGGNKRLNEIAYVYRKFRNENYENAFKTLVKKRRKVKKVNQIINKMIFLKRSRIRKFLLNLFFPVLKYIKENDYEFFIKRIIGPRR